MYATKKMYWPLLLFIDIIGYALFFWKKFRIAPKKKDIHKVLFIRLEHIGDMIMSTPVFENFKKSNPKCEIHVLCKTLTMPIIKNNPSVDKIITFDPGWMIKREGDRKKSYRQLMDELRNEHYDIIFEMHGDPRNNLLAHRGASGAYIIGYGCRGSGFLLNKVKRYDTKIHNIDQNLDLIRDFAKITVRDTKIITDVKSRDIASRLMMKNNLEKGRFTIINPLSGRHDKDLSDEEVIRFIEENTKGSMKVLIVGSKSETDHNQRFTSLKGVVDITGKTSILELTEIVKMARKVIAPDTGIVHIAKSVGTPFQAIYKTTDRKRWGY